ncbi:MAG: chromosomal replication initiator protein DnaA [Fimbriimonadaceae bacterium]|nr:chromosomal replication initiator protein DnaA [Fimbriimonadaceae bacterium]
MGNIPFPSAIVPDHLPTMSDQYSFEDQGDVVALRTAWERVLEDLKGVYTETSLSRFLRPLKPIAFENGNAVLLAQGQFIQTWVQEKYLPDLEDRLTEVIGDVVHLTVTSEVRRQPTPVTPPEAVVRVPVHVDAAKYEPDERYRFDNFVVGPSNQLAFAGAKAVASEPGEKYNPLFVFGPSGVGKTHLLHAIANEAMLRHPNLGVHYITAQSFLEQFVHAIQNGKMDQFRRSHRTVGMWLLDDVQLIMGRDRTQEEVFHTFNYLHGLKKQIVMCSDRPPRELMQFTDRLRTRLEAGLIADVKPPDTETRTAILLRKAEEKGIPLEPDLALQLSAHLAGSVRRLEGALNTAWAQASVLGCDINSQIVDHVVEALKSSYTGPARLDTVLKIVGEHYQVAPDLILGESRKAHIAQARHVAIYIMKTLANGSWKHLGAQFGGRDHTSVMHGFRKVSSLMDADRELNATVNMLMQKAGHME